MATTEDMLLPRRTLMTGALALALAPAARSAPGPSSTSATPSERERANMAMMRAFWVAWNAVDLDIDAVVRKYMAPDATVRWSDDAPVYKGAADAAAAAKASMPRGSRAFITIHEMFAHGPMVATNRTDVINVPGQPDAVFDTAGVAFIVNGKIVEYSDYVLR